MFLPAGVMNGHDRNPAEKRNEHRNRIRKERISARGSADEDGARALFADVTSGIAAYTRGPIYDKRTESRFTF
jgi:hypothetical protein